MPLQMQHNNHLVY